MNIVTIGLTALYPIVIWLFHGRLEPRWLACLLLLAAALRLHLLKISRSARWLAGIAILLAVVAIGSNALLPLKMYPVLINGVMLAVFSYSLISPPSIIERIARLRDPAFPDAAVRYTRRVTVVWCVFFVVNGAIALYTALWSSEEVWSLYNGVIAYVLMGLLFGIEFLFRIHFKRLHDV
ncbi:hypothetical protein [Oxalicibacterium solurbis]|uniref:Membrane protein n=1 Tax=Oxalicibacterium solurbis TaxID=69280 RepID=A0A8J3B3T8_9BURK|nr:hypothetical protein [Oxalicibacterium solurbis]GGI54284.1 membrane protein [Oxalicibacterium solurbis]